MPLSEWEAAKYGRQTQMALLEIYPGLELECRVAAEWGSGLEDKVLFCFSLLMKNNLNMLESQLFTKDQIICTGHLLGCVKRSTAK